jgi:hypothetical protein
VNSDKLLIAFQAYLAMQIKPTSMQPLAVTMSLYSRTLIMIKLLLASLFFFALTVTHGQTNVYHPFADSAFCRI